MSSPIISSGGFSWPQDVFLNLKRYKGYSSKVPDNTLVRDALTNKTVRAGFIRTVAIQNEQHGFGIKYRDYLPGTEIIAKTENKAVTALDLKQAFKAAEGVFETAATAAKLNKII